MNKSLEVTRFFEKKITLVHKYKPHEARFCAARFFSGTKNRVSRGLAVLSNNRNHSNKLLKSHKFSKQREKKHDYPQMGSLTAYDYFRQTKLHVLITLSENS